MLFSTYPYTNEVTNYAKDSTIDISPDRWGNLVVYVNGEDVVVMPKPFAVDAAGKRFEMDFVLDKKAKTITVAGDLTGAKYPVTVDPTERVTNGGFETGDKTGWTTVVGNTNYYTVKSDTPFEGSYYLDVIGAGGYSGLRQTLYYNSASTVSNAVAIPHYNRYDLPLSNVWLTYGNWYLNNPGQVPHGWLTRSTAVSISGPSTLDIWTYSNTHGHLDSVSVIAADPPVADFSGTPLTGTAPLTVQFTDLSTNAPTSWSWTFGDGGTSALQNPSHQYTSAGTYTVSLTVANAAGSDGETKTDYITVTAPVSNQATDVAGRDVTLTDAENAASQQESMNYQAEIFYHATPSDIVKRLPNDQIFFFFGHGTKGAIQINDINLPSDLNLLYGSNMPNSFDEASTSYSNMKLGVLLACKAGGTDPIYGNIVDVLASKGASCAMGWTENIETAGASAWSSTFWNRI